MNSVILATSLPEMVETPMLYTWGFLTVILIVLGVFILFFALNIVGDIDKFEWNKRDPEKEETPYPKKSIRKNSIAIAALTLLMVGSIVAIVKWDNIYEDHARHVAQEMSESVESRYDVESALTQYRPESVESYNTMLKGIKQPAYHDALMVTEVDGAVYTYKMHLNNNGDITLMQKDETADAPDPIEFFKDATAE